MLIDSTHKRWFLATLISAGMSLAFYGWFYYQTPGGLTGGSTIGLWYGIAGSGLMIYAGLLAFLRRVPSWWWIGARQTWLRGHIWLGMLSGLMILCHSGFRWGGLIEQMLWVVVILVLATGVYGLILQQFLPRLIAARIPGEAPYEQIPHLSLVLRDEADAIVNGLCGPPDPKAKNPVRLEEGAADELQMFYQRQVRQFLSDHYLRTSPLAHPLQSEAMFTKVANLPGFTVAKDAVAQLQRLCDERRQLGEQERLYHWLHGWLLLHIPLSVALLVLGVVHAVMSLYY